MPFFRRLATRFLVAAVLLPFPPAGWAEPAAIRLHGLVRQAGGGVALLQFGAGRPRTLRIGESHRGFTVKEVLLDRVVLEAAEGEVFDLHFPERSSPPFAAPVSSGQARPPTDAPVPPVGAEEEAGVGADPPVVAIRAAPPAADTGERRLSRDEIRLRLQSELPRILTNAVVAPRVRGSEVVGLELVAFPMDTVLGETGLVPGDVLMRVNGREVRGAESLAVLVQRFQTASDLELTVDRAGEIFALRYRIE